MKAAGGKRAPFAAALLLGVSALSCAESALSTDRGERRPSAVLISVDTLRADHLGLYGYERETSPYLDRLAEESLVFERAFAPAAWTLISHVTMLTGLYPHQHGVVEGGYAVAHETPFVAELLQRAGYQTVGLYYEGWIHPRHGFERGFDVFRSHESAEEAEEHLQEVFAELDPERPFFLFLHLFDVHSGPFSNEPGPIYDCPPPYDEMFLEGAAQRLPQVAEKRIWADVEPLEPDEVEALVALYDGGIRYVDDKLERWIEGWQRGGWLDDALLVITSDHGEALCQRGRIRDHGGPYQEGLRVPLIVRLPGGERAGERIRETVHLVDVAPTLLDFTGLDVPDELPGRSLLRPLEVDRAVYAWSPPSFEVLVEWPEKLVHVGPSDTHVRVDLENDPEELRGLPLDEEEFQRRLARFRERLGERSWPAPLEIDEPELDAIQEKLRDLGYAGG